MPSTDAAPRGLSAAPARRDAAHVELGFDVDAKRRVGLATRRRRAAVGLAAQHTLCRGR